MVRDVLVYGGFDLGEESVSLESPAEEHRRLDVSVGAVIIECKRDIRSPMQVAKGKQQLGEYLAAKAPHGRYAGVLTDGAIWQLYRHTSTGPVIVNELKLGPSHIDERAFRWWLGAILATEHRIQPTANAIEERLGAGAPSFGLVHSALLDCWHSVDNEPAVTVKRQLWAKLLRSALGSQFEDTVELFVEHTYLVILATLIGHAVIGFDLDVVRNDPGLLLSGEFFEQVGVLGVGQAGFFDWVLDAPEGTSVISDIARRVASFSWTDVGHDVLKALYQSVIPPAVRKRLGEYYTPDWLAKHMVDQVVTDPLHQRVLDPACGSGTFMFHAVRSFLRAAEEASVPVSDALAQVARSVSGVDLHPVAVALAQTTYLLAIGPDRISQRKATLSIPVYLGDSMQWEAADAYVLTPTGEVVLYVTDEDGHFESELRFPAAVVADVGVFDTLVNELASRASNREQGGPRPSIDGLLKNLAIAEEDKPAIRTTYSVLCDLYDADRNHIWGYYIRNQSRPAWLSLAENRVDVLVGNPPWLAYRFMPVEMQQIFRKRAMERNLWSGGARGRSAQQDLSAFFVVRAIELYLREGGRFGFVMPRAVLSRQTYSGFRSGQYTAIESCRVAFSEPWDLGRVRPQPFPVPASVIFGYRIPHAGDTAAIPLGSRVLAWSGNAPPRGVDAGNLSTTEATVSAISGEEEASPYKTRFRAGAILYPRMLMMVVDAPKTPLGVPQGKRAVRSRKSSLDKVPWKDLPAQSGVIESSFVRPAYLGESVAPFRILKVPEAVIPYDGTRFMDGKDERIDRYPGLAKWWRAAEQTWEQHRSSKKRTLIEQLDYMKQLSSQFPIRKLRVVYTASGNTLASAIIQDSVGVVEHKLYWAPASTMAEAQYLSAVLNTPALNDLVKPFQSQGLFGPRDFDKYVWQSPIPAFDPDNALHIQLSDLAVRAADVSLNVSLEGISSFQTARRVIRKALTAAGIATALDEAVLDLLGGAGL
jgi:hypothetical protein